MKNKEALVMSETNELYHHGRLGMKWGKRNGPPYPLDYSKLSYAEREAAKGKAVATGNIQEAAKNIDYFDNNELSKVKERFNLNQQIKNLNASTIKTGKQKVDSIIDWANRFGRGAEAAMNIYNKAAKFNNAFASGDDKLMPVIGEAKPRKNKADGKSKAELLKMMRNTNMSTKDYEDIKNRINMINETENAFREGKKMTADDLIKIYDDPMSYAKLSETERRAATNMVKDMNLIYNSAALKNESAKREAVEEQYRKAKEEEDEIRKLDKQYYAFYHSEEFQERLNNELTHYAKGSTKSGAKYISRSLKNGRWVYKYPDKKNNTKSPIVTYSEVELSEPNQPIDHKPSIVSSIKPGEKANKRYGRTYTTSEKARNFLNQSINTIKSTVSAVAKYLSYNVTKLLNSLKHEDVNMGDYIITNDGHLLSEDELMHFGVLGMKWGVRRYQNPDGSLTEAGYKRYGRKNLDASMRTDIRQKKPDDARRTATATSVAALAGGAIAIGTGNPVLGSMVLSGTATALINAGKNKVTTSMLKRKYADIVAERKRLEDQNKK